MRPLRSPQMAAKPSIRPPTFGRKIEITESDGRRRIGTLAEQVRVEGIMLLFCREKSCIGHIEFIDDFDHVQVEGLPKVHRLCDVMLIAIDDD